MAFICSDRSYGAVVGAWENRVHIRSANKTDGGRIFIVENARTIDGRGLKTHDRSTVVSTESELLTRINTSHPPIVSFFFSNKGLNMETPARPSGVMKGQVKSNNHGETPRACDKGVNTK